LIADIAGRFLTLEQLVQHEMELELAFVSMRDAIRGKQTASGGLAKLSESVPEYRQILIAICYPEPTYIDASGDPPIYDENVVEREISVGHHLIWGER